MNPSTAISESALNNNRMSFEPLRYFGQSVRSRESSPRARLTRSPLRYHHRNVGPVPSKQAQFRYDSFIIALVQIVGIRIGVAGDLVGLGLVLRLRTRALDFFSFGLVVFLNSTALVSRPWASAFFFTFIAFLKLRSAYRGLLRSLPRDFCSESRSGIYALT